MIRLSGSYTLMILRSVNIVIEWIRCRAFPFALGFGIFVGMQRSQAAFHGVTIDRLLGGKKIMSGLVHANMANAD